MLYHFGGRGPIGQVQVLECCWREDTRHYCSSPVRLTEEVMEEAVDSYAHLGEKVIYTGLFWRRPLTWSKGGQEPETQRLGARRGGASELMLVSTPSRG